MLTLPCKTIGRALKEACNIHPRAFAMVYVDQHGHLQYETSAGLRARQQELFPLEFEQHFLYIVEQQERNGQQGRKGSRSGGYM